MSAILGMDPDGIFEEISGKKEPIAYPAGRLCLVTWNPSAPGAQEAYGEDHAILDDSRGIMACCQKCPHLGCRVPWCQTSQWFECPCHGSKYNQWGEWDDGPAPRGLDRFPSEIVDGTLQVNTGIILTGPARTANVLVQEPEGAALHRHLNGRRNAARGSRVPALPASGQARKSDIVQCDRDREPPAPRLSRRSALTALGAAAGGAVLAACGVGRGEQAGGAAPT
ncbi:MAG: ubiquinol-cytochrome c reductase iron-sulfur subunit, partial [Nitriliruptorales bacterium]